jgi:hypothetical protein
MNSVVFPTSMFKINHCEMYFKTEYASKVQSGVQCIQIGHCDCFQFYFDVIEFWCLQAQSPFEYELICCCEY